MHPTDAELLLSGEAGEGDAARLHLDRCPACRERLADLVAEARSTFELLSALDRPIPRPDVETLVALASQSPSIGGSGKLHRSHHPSGWGIRVPLRVAAGILLAAVAVAAAVLPTSPLRRLLEDGETPRESRGVEAAALAEAGGVSGFAFTPEGPVRIELPPAGGPDEVMVMRHEGAEVRVTSDPGVTFALVAGRDGVLTLGSEQRLTTLTVAIPPGLETLSLSRDGDLLWTGGPAREPLPRLGGEPLILKPRR